MPRAPHQRTAAPGKQCADACNAWSNLERDNDPRPCPFRTSAAPRHERPARMTVYFIRHGQTDWNAEGRLQGQRDVPLNATGLGQAESVAERLKAVAGASLAEAAFVASPLTRTRQTMEVLRASLDLAPKAYAVDTRLMEINFGTWEGSTWAEIRRRDSRGALARDRDRWGYRPPGEHGESYAMLVDRVRPAIADLQRPAVIVAHGGVARAILVILGYTSIREAPRMGIRQGSVLVLDQSRWRWA
ncbi:2,3-bisphosphoglycerate-dependent phosphoglycerate mutase [Methylobacterium bullatum]|uniref:2,3-bisphosphoglycerate-dependent phosphoglycerate mutase n=2 Tax=Methylobacterium bullatum TaxID=570505 RepID=A0AAV4Z773_9HYPH|nr:2,3-bisphosphoglycerate-dependent phosphoglycerate mutase [Methylobacterium bullatum]